MQQSQKGDEPSYNLLLTEVTQYLKPFIAKKLGPVDHKEDLIQDVLLTIHRFRHTFDASRPFKPWLHAIVHSRLMDFWKTHKKKTENEYLNKEDETESYASEEYISHIEINDFKKAINSLPESQRKIVLLLKFDGRSIKQVAVELGISESAVKVAAHRGYKRIHEVIVGK